MLRKYVLTFPDAYKVSIDLTLCLQSLTVLTLMLTKSGLTYPDAINFLFDLKRCL